MIFTCTLNPSLDYYMEFDGPLQAGSRMNRSNLEYYEAGGKGINVSIVLNNLGIPSRALGFIGGFTKDFYIQLLAKYDHIIPNFTYINGHTRINVKCHASEHTNMNAAGPYITDGDMKNLYSKAERLAVGDYFVLAGITPEYLENDVLDMLKMLIDNGVRVVLDTNPELMKKALDLKPFLIKTTAGELGEMFGEKIETIEEAAAGAKKLHELGSMNAAVIFENREAVFSCDKGTYQAEILHHDKAVNTVGTGDSLIAGFMMDYLRTRDAVDSFRFGVSCGSATAYSRGLATREKIDAMYDGTELIKLD
ncbi:MAG: 1-phosphofructokinase family hexose kinase [Erysipelotrichaceae bacterium]|nr:1-phosphofructokinase family hexose kinase [Erysipelotrichaceae bacterium]